MTWIAVLLATVVAIVLSRPAQGLQFTITPLAPRLGDTISVILQPAHTPTVTPTVTIDQTTYPTFPIGGNRFRALVPSSPLDKPRVLRLVVTDGIDTRNIALQLKARSFPVQHIWLPPGKSDLGTDYEFDRVAIFKQLVTPDKFWNGKLLRPSSGPITAGYGIRRYYNGVFAHDYYHRGVDYGAGAGSPVVSPAAGRVALVGYESQGFEVHGNTVGVDHGQGVTSIFLHLNSIRVKEGDFVQPGQVIGTIGSTGAVTGPHLHWGLYVNGVSIDPAPWRDRGFE
ncbi:MAG: M23 family metallopeptidase [Cyanobacteria bacterium]|nr:M23 family metallopeptidase [Cyanobacteriota bacterium]MDW8200461.1 M23 family metallopeptidase [Cyanobacteriota bacterium SKYGB_h_bin112]